MLMQFYQDRASVKFGNRVNEWNNKFGEIQEDRALNLHDILENIDRYNFCRG